MVGEEVEMQIVIDLHEIDSDLKVELVVTETDPGASQTKHFANCAL